MPEGDTLYQIAQRLQPLVGSRVVKIEGSSRAVQELGGRAAGRTVESVESRGKHLLVHLSGDLSMRSHLGMTGIWHLYGIGKPWRKTEGKARLVIETGTHVAVCFAAPDVSIGPPSSIEAELAHLGPDLVGPEFDSGAVVERAAASAAASATDLLLDQTVMAGVGNVYKSEVLFLERMDPRTLAVDLSAEQIERLAARARRLLWANRERAMRNTTGYGRNANLWVYRRERRPCRRCGTNIESARLGDLERSTYWCPRCQPGPGR